MRKLLLPFGGLFLAAIVVFAFGKPSTVRADTRTHSWDVVTCIAPVDLDGDTTADDACQSTGLGDTYEDVGSNGWDVGDHPEQISNVWIDPLLSDNPNYVPGPPADADAVEAFFDGATTVWSGGIVPEDGNTVNDGAQAGEITFIIQSNLTAAGTNNILAFTTGQPPQCDYAPVAVGTPPKLGGTAPLYDAELANSPSVSQLDKDGDGTPQTLEDNFDADGNAGANGLYDGIDLMPQPLPLTYIALGYPSGSLVSRGFARAEVAVIAGSEVTQDVNFSVFDLTADPEIAGYLSLTMVGYPGQPTNPPTATNVLDQTVETCPPFLSSPVRIFGLSLDNTTACLGNGCTGSPAPAIDGGDAVRTVADDTGTYEYRIAFSQDEDYDGDGIANWADYCPTDPTGGVDTDGDGLTDSCDTNGEGTGCTGTQATTPPFNVCQDIDQDGFLNKEDNCPNTPNGVSPDVQEDSDADTVGDACDAAPLIPGDGNGYAGGFLDLDDTCVDEYVTNAAEPAGEADAPAGLRKYCYSSQTGGAPSDNPDQLYINAAPAERLATQTAGAVTTYNDSDVDDDPDYVVEPAAAGWAAIYLVDTDSDSDFDGHSDACEGYNGTDALDASSTPGPPAVPRTLGGGDCDGGGVPDYLEELNTTDPFATPGDDGTLPVVDTDADGCTDIEELGSDNTLGGVRNPLDPWDFFDVPRPVGAPGTGTKDKQIDGNDALAVLSKFGASPGDPVPAAPLYDPAYDRGAPSPNAWNTTEADGVQDGNDVIRNLNSFGNSCFAPPN